MSVPAKVVIAGAGLAGAKTAQALRDKGFDGAVTLIGKEPHRPYERPPLSKDYLQGKTGRDSIDVHEPGYYVRHDIDLRSGTAVTGIDPHSREVVLGDGHRLGYDRLVLHQPATVADAILGRPASYQRLPYFYTDQYELSMEYTGYTPPGGTDQLVVRGAVDRLEFIAFWLCEGRVLSGMNVNTWGVTDPIGQLIRDRTPINPDRLADPDVPLTDLTTPW